MFRHGHATHLSSPMRPLALLLLVLALLAGCGQKGDLYRPGKTQKLAVHAVLTDHA